MERHPEWIEAYEVRRHSRLSGFYNQQSPTGKIIPWTAKSFFDLAILCLEAMGRSDWLRTMPAELFSMMPGPPTTWEHVLPLVALQRLAAAVGHRVCWAEERVTFVPLQEG
jgi:hypothetical protein